jgi:hypothetical protein
MQLKEVNAWTARATGEHSTTKAWTSRRSCRRTGTGAGATQPPKFDGSTSWAMFENMVEHSDWMPCDKATCLIAALSEPSAHILHDVPIGATYEEVVATLENHYGDHQVEEAFRAQLKRRARHFRESLQEFPAVIRPRGSLCLHQVDRTTHQGRSLPGICQWGKVSRNKMPATLSMQGDTQ